MSFECENRQKEPTRRNKNTLLSTKDENKVGRSSESSADTVRGREGDRTARNGKARKLFAALESRHVGKCFACEQIE